MSEGDLVALSVEIQGCTALLLRFFNQGLERRLSEHGEALSSLQYGILRMLQFETLTISVLSQRMGMDPSALVRIVDALERKELALRGIDPHDRRRNPIHITEKGQALLAAIPSVAGEDIAFHALQALGEEKARQLCDRLRELIFQIPEGRLILGHVAEGVGQEAR